jgi:hypothetical protein
MAMVVFLSILNSITIGVNPIHGLLDVQFHDHHLLKDDMMSLSHHLEIFSLMYFVQTSTISLVVYALIVDHSG